MIPDYQKWSKWSKFSSDSNKKSDNLLAVPKYILFIYILIVCYLKLIHWELAEIAKAVAIAYLNLTSAEQSLSQKFALKILKLFVVIETVAKELFLVTLDTRLAAYFFYKFFSEKRNWKYLFRDVAKVGEGRGEDVPLPDLNNFNLP